MEVLQGEEQAVANEGESETRRQFDGLFGEVADVPG